MPKPLDMAPAPLAELLERVREIRNDLSAAEHEVRGGEGGGRRGGRAARSRHPRGGAAKQLPYLDVLRESLLGGGAHLFPSHLLHPISTRRRWGRQRGLGRGDSAAGPLRGVAGAPAPAPGARVGGGCAPGFARVHRGPDCSWDATWPLAAPLSLKAGRRCQRAHAAQRHHVQFVVLGRRGRGGVGGRVLGCSTARLVAAQGQTPLLRRSCPPCRRSCETRMAAAAAGWIRCWRRGQARRMSSPWLAPCATLCRCLLLPLPGPSQGRSPRGMARGRHLLAVRRPSRASAAALDAGSKPLRHTPCSSCVTAPSTLVPASAHNATPHLPPSPFFFAPVVVTGCTPLAGFAPPVFPA